MILKTAFRRFTDSSTLKSALLAEKLHLGTGSSQAVTIPSTIRYSSAPTFRTSLARKRKPVSDRP